MSVPKKTECLVCYKVKMITPCGANNNCGVYICMDCKCDNDVANNYSRGIMDNNIFNCVICKQPEYKLSVTYWFMDNVNNFLLNEDDYGYEVWNTHYDDRLSPYTAP